MATTTKPGETERGAEPRHGFSLTSYRKELGIFGLLLAVCIMTTLKNHDFLGADNLQNLARLIGIYGIYSIGAGIAIITSGIDLSVGSVFALEGVLLSMVLTEHNWPAALAVLAMIALCMALGLIHGLLITRVPLQPFIVTLCGLLFYRGLARFISGDATKGFGEGTGFEGLINLATGSLLGIKGHYTLFGSYHFWMYKGLTITTGNGIPMPFLVMLLIAAVMWVVLHRSVYGRYLYAVGRNEEAARYSGIDSRAILTSAYVVAGLLTGIAGILLAFYTNSISPSSHGNSYELYGIAAAVLGGCSLRGGEGSVVGILIGTALLQVLQNLVNLLGIPSSLNFAVIGAVILLGVVADEVMKKRNSAVKTRETSA